MSGGAKGAKRPLGRPLDGVVRRHVGTYLTCYEYEAHGFRARALQRRSDICQSEDDKRHKAADEGDPGGMQEQSGITNRERLVVAHALSDNGELR